MTITALRRELADERPRYAPELLSRAERDRQIARAMHALYRWYVDRSQAKRNWNPDRSFAWRDFRRDHSPELLAILEGFFAVEQYVPDYTAEIVRLVRRNYGRSHFTLRWGAEEEKHADLWRNTLLFSGQRDPGQLERYADDLRRSTWALPWDEPIRMLLYTVIQERATQLNYLNVARIARGESDKPQFAGDADPVLLQAATAIAVDEAAHYDFFLEGARLYLYYYPEETLGALVDVLRHFTMPAAALVPNYDGFIKALYAGGVFGRRQYVEEVVRPALANLGVASIREVEAGIARLRRVPDEAGYLRDTACFAGLDLTVVEAAVERLFGRIGRYEAEVGLAEVDPTRFVRWEWAGKGNEKEGFDDRCA